MHYRKWPADKWLSNTKQIIQDVVLAHDVQEAIKWIYSFFVATQ